ncbi:MAG TPA: SHOCT domain-containing protein [Solirubrobacterales bacterium]|nr:SHOCT domain-containing protein [Solirubrobacterales bacterium]
MRRRILAARGAEARIDALRKLKDLFDAGVLTARQYSDERDRLLGG